jgi:ABC-type transport system involved in cytochrome bd biosynthesis fused ATPase/permease subunit
MYNYYFFLRSIKQYLREKICILATHQIQFLQDATTIIFLNNVRIEVNYFCT